MKEKKDTYSYKGWLNSDNFLKRVFAIFGYYTVASLIISAIFFGIVIVFFMFIALIGLIAFL